MSKFAKLFIVVFTSLAFLAMPASDVIGKGSKSGSSSKGGSKPSKPSKPPASKPPKPPAAKPPSKPPANKPPKKDPPAAKPPKKDPPAAKPPKKDPPKEEKKPKYSSPDAGSKNKKGDNKTNPSKPPKSDASDKARANKGEHSKRIYVDSKKATAPPKTEYVASNGKKVKVQKDSVAVKKMRERPSNYYHHEVRTQRIDVYCHNHHYYHPYSWYYSQPTFYIGGGYSCSFWYMMMEWDYHRRALWFYNNQSIIERDAYERGMRDAQVAAEVARLRAQNAPVRGQDYIDPELSDDPSIQFDQDYVEAAYNPTIAPDTNDAPSSGVGTIILWLVLGIGLITGLVIGLYFLIFKMKIGQ